ncbi:hypothetical protein [Microbacterium sp. CFBP9034]|uniref:hypothetical protein n=1 Tax=Microbacterium sp. CFBP9034 TaxID=3096540 RepID=UPI002A6B243D|nr:hypothetical protein [Microbacterium sp. CFBP9034]MDY0910557.1 hypothetical protein [Microbacterium sp. CFBP9034]
MTALFPSPSGDGPRPAVAGQVDRSSAAGNSLRRTLRVGGVLRGQLAVIGAPLVLGILALQLSGRRTTVPDRPTVQVYPPPS